MAVLAPRAMLVVEEMMVRRGSLEGKEILVPVASLDQMVKGGYLGLQGSVDPREMLVELVVLVHQEPLAHLDSKAHLDHRGHRAPQVTRDPRELQVHLALTATTEQLVPLELQVMPVPLELMAREGGEERLDLRVFRAHLDLGAFLVPMEQLVFQGPPDHLVHLASPERMERVDCLDPRVKKAL